MMTREFAGQLWPLVAFLQLKVLLILSAAWLLTLALRRASSAVRHAVWATALLGVLLLPAGTLLPARAIALPAWAASPLLEVTVTPSVARAAQHDAMTAPPSAVSAVVVSAAQQQARTVTRDVPWWAFVLLLWLGGTLLRLTWLAVQVMRMRGVHADSDAGAARAQAAATEIARVMRVRAPVRVQFSTGVTMPCTTGLLHPVILLPRSAASWPEERVRVVLLHELAHIRRNDYAVWLLTELVCAVYWINPAVWLVRGRVHAEQEQACDDEVLSHGVSPVEYAQHLLDVARAFYTRRHAAGVALSLAREITLKQRVRAILDLQRNRQRRATRTGALAIAALTLWVVSVSVVRASVRPAPATTERSADLSGSPVPPVASAHGVPEPMPLVAVSSSPPQPSRPPTKPAALPFVVATAVSNEVQLPLTAGSPAYYVWARVRVGNRDANSFAVTFGERELTWHVDADDRDERDVWRWERVEIDGDELRIPAASGAAHVRLRAAELGAEIDAALLTSERQYRPRGARPMLPPAHTVELWLEAEDAHVTAPFVQERDRRAAQGGYLRVAGREHSRSAPPSEGTATFAVVVPRAGAYLIWARTRIDGDDEDSFWVRANDGAWFAWNGIDADEDWEWSAVRNEDAAHAITVDLHAGNNTITFAYREPGARLDRLLITNDPRLTPRSSAKTQQGNRPQP